MPWVNGRLAFAGIVFFDPPIKESDLQEWREMPIFTSQSNMNRVMEEKILKALQEKGAMRPGDIAAAAGVEKAEADKVIKKLVKEGKVYSPKRCFYDIQK